MIDVDEEAPVRRADASEEGAEWKLTSQVGSAVGFLVHELVERGVSELRRQASEVEPGQEELLHRRCGRGQHSVVVREVRKEHRVPFERVAESSLQCVLVDVTAEL